MRYTSTCTRYGLAAALAAALVYSSNLPVAAADKGYAVGERLKPGAAAAAPAPAAAYRRLSWDDLVPKGWDPMKELNLPSLGALVDNDPRAQAALEKLRKLWDNAPVRTEWNGARVRLPGFVVPLDVEGASIQEFLLVPYFGACIHTPPPPSNQVVHVILDRPAKGVHMMDTVWVLGEMQVVSSVTGMGTAGYRIQGRQVLPYRE